MNSGYKSSLSFGSLNATMPALVFNGVPCSLNITTIPPVSLKFIGYTSNNN